MKGRDIQICRARKAARVRHITGQEEEIGYNLKNFVRIYRRLSFLVLAAAFLAGGCAASAQQPFYERFREHNARMRTLQPSWATPLIQSDARLSQAVRFSFANSFTPAKTQTTNYGNYHTLGLLVGNRVQANLIAPPYVQNNSATAKDGFADTQLETKIRVASGDAGHGNYIVTGKLTWDIATGSHKNGAATSYLNPTLLTGRAWGRFNLQTALGGDLPTGKIALQGRQIEWDMTGQVHAMKNLWLDVENNANFRVGGPYAGKQQNFVTPAAFFALRRKNWKQAHAVMVLGAGMQLATSGFHLSNHNLVSEMRIIF